MTRGLSIAIVSNYFMPHKGGAENQNRLIGEALVRRGHRVTVFTRWFDSRLPPREWISGLDVRRLLPSGQSMLAKWLMNFSTAWHLMRARPGFDLVFVTQISPHALGPALASQVRRIPLVLRPIEHGELSGDISNQMLSKTAIAEDLIRFVMNAARQWAYRRATRMIVVSKGLEREALNFGFPPAALVPIPNAIDMTRFRPATAEQRVTLRGELGLPPDGEVVVWVGRLVRKKGLETMIDAWSGLTHIHPRTLLLIVGAGPGTGHIHDAEETLRASVAARGLQASVKLTGPVPDVERYLRASDLFVFTSEAEGFGVALVEAMACGLPVITSRIEGAAADLVDDGREGLKFDVGNACQLRTCLAKLLSEPESRLRMGSAGSARVKGTLDVECIAVSYERLFKAIVEDTRTNV
jgi:glycosyltransferase involved in cell wall biosynthesis